MLRGAVAVLALWAACNQDVPDPPRARASEPVSGPPLVEPVAADARRGFEVADDFSDPVQDAAGAAVLDLLRKRQATGTRSLDKEIRDKLRIVCRDSPSSLKKIDTAPIEDLVPLDYLSEAVGIAGCGTLTTSDPNNSVVWGKLFEPRPP